jgi:sporulation protein YlmC with PRC-barrel domain
MWKFLVHGSLAIAALAAPAAAREKRSEVTAAGVPAGDRGGKESTSQTRREQPFRLVRASSLIGEQIRNAKGENLGLLQELAVDANARRIAYAIVDFSGLAMGDKLFAVPWPALSTRFDEKGPPQFVLDADKDRLKDAKGFDRGRWPQWADQSWARDTHAFYGQQPYWEQSRSQELRGEPISPQKRSRRGSSRERTIVIESPQPFILKSNEEVLGHAVRHASNGETLGEINDLLIDPRTGDLAFVVVQLDRNSSARRSDRHKNFVALPAAMFTWDRHGDPNYPYTIECCLQRLRESRFASDHWPDLSSKQWAQGLYDSFGRQAYWEQK